MTGKEYADRAYKYLSEGLKGIIAKAFEAGLKQHEHDYLVKTIKIRNEYEAQIEKMQCCGNCENRYGQEKCADCHNYSKWKFKQAEQFYEEIAD